MRKQPLLAGLMLALVLGLVPGMAIAEDAASDAAAGDNAATVVESNDQATAEKGASTLEVEAPATEEASVPEQAEAADEAPIAALDEELPNLADTDLHFEGSSIFTDINEALDCLVLEMDDEVLPVEAYELKVFDSEENEVDLASVDTGSYYIVAYAKDGSGYEGKTNQAWFEIVAENDLRLAELDVPYQVRLGDDFDVAVSLNGVVLAEGDDYELVFTDDEGLELQGVPETAGEYNVFARGLGEYADTETSISTFRVIDPTSLDGGVIYLEKSVYVANDEPVELSIDSVDNAFGEMVDSDSYELVYYTWDDDQEDYVALDGVPSEEGTYSVAAHGIDPYSGVTEKEEFRIVGAMDFASAEFDLAESRFTVGDAIELEPTVTLADGTVADRSGYHLVYFDEDGEALGEETPTAAGWYAVAAVANEESKYSGETYRYELTIVDPRNLEFGHVVANDVAYTGSAITPDFSVEIDEEVVPAKYYDLVYYQIDEEDDYVQLDGAPVEVGRYAVRAVGKDAYSGQTGTSEFAVYDAKNLGNADLALSKDAYPVTGGAVQPQVESVTMQYGDYGEVAASNYELVYYADDEGEETLDGAPTEVGEYYVAARGVDPYTGETSRQRFEIVEINSLKAAEFTFADALSGSTYAMYPTGTDVASKISLTLNGEAVDSSAYTLGFFMEADEGEWEPVSDFTERGWYRVTAVGDGETYTDTAVGEFSILGENNLRLADVSIEPASYAYTGSAIVPNLTVKMGDTVLGTDDLKFEYVVNGKYTDEAPVEVGKYSVYAWSESGDYEGETAPVDFSIVPVDIADAKLVLSKTSFTFNNEVQKPSVKTVDGKTLKEGTDYTVAYSNKDSKAAGTYEVTVTGAGHYTGTSAKATYTIAKANNPLTAKAKTVKAKAKKVKKKAQKVAATKAIVVSGAQGKVTYKLTKVTAKKKLAKQAKKKIKMAANGQITLKKGLKKGTYKLTVQVSAAGNGNYKAATKTVTVKIKVK